MKRGEKERRRSDLIRKEGEGSQITLSPSTPSCCSPYLPTAGVLSLSLSLIRTAAAAATAAATTGLFSLQSHCANNREGERKEKSNLANFFKVFTPLLFLLLLRRWNFSLGRFGKGVEFPVCRQWRKRERREEEKMKSIIPSKKKISSLFWCADFFSSEFL